MTFEEVQKSDKIKMLSSLIDFLELQKKYFFTELENVKLSGQKEKIIDSETTLMYLDDRINIVNYHISKNEYIMDTLQSIPNGTDYNIIDSETTKKDMYDEFYTLWEFSSAIKDDIDEVPSIVVVRYGTRTIKYNFDKGTFDVKDFNEEMA